MSRVAHVLSGMYLCGKCADTVQMTAVIPLSTVYVCLFIVYVNKFNTNIERAHHLKE